MSQHTLGCYEYSVQPASADIFCKTIFTKRHFDVTYRKDKTFYTKEDSLEILSNEIFMLCKLACLHSFGLSSMVCYNTFHGIACQKKDESGQFLSLCK